MFTPPYSLFSSKQIQPIYREQERSIDHFSARAMTVAFDKKNSKLPSLDLYQGDAIRPMYKKMGVGYFLFKRLP
jgi:hypothetical protein